MTTLEIIQRSIADSAQELIKPTEIIHEGNATFIHMQWEFGIAICYYNAYCTITSHSDDKYYYHDPSFPGNMLTKLGEIGPRNLLHIGEIRCNHAKYKV